MDILFEHVNASYPPDLCHAFGIGYHGILQRVGMSHPRALDTKLSVVAPAILYRRRLVGFYTLKW